MTDAAESILSSEGNGPGESGAVFGGHARLGQLRSFLTWHILTIPPIGNATLENVSGRGKVGLLDWWKASAHSLARHRSLVPFSCAMMTRPPWIANSLAIVNSGTDPFPC